MYKVLKAAKFAALILVALLLIAIAYLISLRTYHQHRNAQLLAIRSPNGIDEAMYVRIGGIDQWIQIRGQDRDNPVLLCVHGGPGGTWIPFTGLFLPFEKEFTMVLWDQRGAGKTLASTGASVAGTLSVDRMAQDGIEVAEFLKSHLHKDKIILLGHSWGSILGIHMAKQRPDLFYAYVGTGQASNMAKAQQMSYSYVLDKAKAANDTKTVQALETIGQPPFDNMQKIGAFFNALGLYEVASDQTFLAASPTGALTSPVPNYSLLDEINRIRGFMTIPTFEVYREMLSTDLSALGFDFRTPVFFLQGAEDERTQASLAREYFDKINAPKKEMVVFPGAGHFVLWSMSERFLRELVTRVRPLCYPPGANMYKLTLHAPIPRNPPGAL